MQNKDRKPAHARPINYRTMTRQEYNQHPLRQSASHPGIFWIIVSLILGAAMCGPKSVRTTATGKAIILQTSKISQP
jgi:hypothetical protein